jgi:hypothetical protein
MCIFVHMCIFVRMYIFVDIHRRIFFIHINEHEYTSTYISIYRFTYVYVYLCMSTCIYTGVNWAQHLASKCVFKHSNCASTMIRYIKLMMMIMFS